MATIEDSIKLQLARALSEDRGSRAVAEVTVREATPCLQSLSADTHILAGNKGDHPHILRLLSQAFQSPIDDDFQSRLDEPLYAPSDRLLLCRDEQLIGHVQVSKQVGWFHGQRCVFARLQDFVTLPEYRSSELDAPLLEVAESVALNEGALLALVRTDRPEWFEQHGWSCFRGQGHTRANTRAILSHLDAQQTLRKRRLPTIEVRTWRHFQLDSILQLCRRICGALCNARWKLGNGWSVAKRTIKYLSLSILRRGNATRTQAKAR